MTSTPDPGEPTAERSERPPRPGDPSFDARLDVPASSVAADRDDPTGIRALLQALPDPGPMPPEVMARISASLREEAGRLPSGDATLTGTGQVVPLVSPSRARRSRVTAWRMLSGAAAVVIAVGLGSMAMSRLPLGGSDAASGAAVGGAAPELATAADGAARIVGVTESGTTYTVTGLADQAADLVAQRQTDEQMSGSSALDTTQLAACLGGLGLDALEGAVFVDLGVFEGQPALLIAVDRPQQAPAAVIVAPDCGLTEPAAFASANLP